MAENKKAFVLYADLIHTIEKLPADKAGELFKHILRYVNDLNPVTDDIIIEISFEPIKQQLKRDLRKYEEKKLQWSEAGKASAEAKRLAKEATEQERLTDSTDVGNRSTDSTVTVKDSVTVKVNDNNTNTHDIFAARILKPENELDKESIEISCKRVLTKELIKQFNANLTNSSKHHSHYSEWKKHLVNWLSKQKIEVTPTKKYKPL